LPIGRGRHIEIEDMIRFMAKLDETTRERWRQLRVDEEAHVQPILMIG
jgi:hypothetical protein